MSAASPEEVEVIERQLESLASLLDHHALTHLEYQDGHISIVLKKECSGLSFSGTQSAAEDTPSVSTQGEPLSRAKEGTVELTHSAEDHVPLIDSAAFELVTAPLVGLAYQAKEPGAASFVCIGDEVKAGAVLCLIEAMKMFNEVKAPYAGIVTQIHFTDGELVEFGAPLFSLSR